MNRKEIITADLLARVQWGVKCETTKWQNNGQGKPMSKAVGKLIGYSERTGYEVVFNEEDFAEDFDKVKPLLFSSLTEPITVVGETFVPIEKIMALRGFDYWEKITNPEEPNDLVIRLRYEDDSTFLDEFTPLVLNFSSYWNLPFFVTDFMHRNHVNYRLLPGEYIPATNEYA